MKKLFQISFFALTLLFIAASPKAFAANTSLGNQPAQFTQGANDVRSAHSKQAYVAGIGFAPEPLNAILFVAGFATLAFVAFRKKLLTA